MMEIAYALCRFPRVSGVTTLFSLVSRHQRAFLQRLDALLECSSNNGEYPAYQRAYAAAPPASRIPSLRVVLADIRYRETALKHVHVFPQR